jgi:hypothetical protein
VVEEEVQHEELSVEAAVDLEETEGTGHRLRLRYWILDRAI